MSGAAGAPAASPRTRGLTILLALVGDALVVTLFAWLGRSEHAREGTFSGLLGTAWPFLVAVLVSWVVAQAFRRPLAPVRSGIPVWIGTVVVGLLLRGITGGGLALPFVLVTLGVLGVLLIGWRLIATLVIRVIPRSHS